MRLQCWSCRAPLVSRFALVTGSDKAAPIDGCHLACVACAGQQQEGQRALVYLEAVLGTPAAHTVAQKAPK